MKKMFRNTVFGLILGIVFLLIFSGNAQAWIKFNGVENGFDPSGQEEIGEMIITGASNFLQSYSRVLLIFSEIELQGLQQANCEKLAKLINQSIFYLNNTRNTYMRLYQKAHSTPYNDAMITRLRAFNYSELRFNRESGMKGEADITVQLQQGDIRGIFHSAWLESEKMLDDLHFFRFSLQNGNIPEVKFLWNLHQAFSDSLLVGQYASQIFAKMSGK